MWRSIGAVILGYVAMAAAVFVTYTLAYLIMGADGAFRPDSYDVSGLWLVASIVLGLIAAVIGGLICVNVAKDARAPLALAGFGAHARVAYGLRRIRCFGYRGATNTRRQCR